MPEDEEPTVICPNCGALVPVGAPNCFICDEKMPEHVKAEEISPEEIPPVEPEKEKLVEPASIKAEAHKEERAIEKSAEVEVPAWLAPEAQLEVKQVREELAVESKPKPEAEAAPAEKEEEIPAKAKRSGRKAARLKKAYESGKITKEQYIDDLKAVGLPIPPEIEGPPAEVAVPEAQAAERIALPPTEEKPSAEAPAAEEKEVPTAEPSSEGEGPAAGITPRVEIPEEQPEGEKLKEGAVAEEAEETPTAKPTPAEKRKATRMRKAFEAGKISKEVYMENLRALGMPIPPELEQPPEEEAVPPPEQLPESEMAGEAEEKPIEEWKIPEDIVKEIDEATKPAEAEVAVEVPEAVVPEELPTAVEEEAPEIKEEVPAAELVSRGEVEEARRSYRGVAVASTGGLVYVLVLLVFMPFLGTAISALILALCAVLIVVGYNITSNDATAAKRARRFSCPLCDTKLDILVSECTNCGAKFSD